MPPYLAASQQQQPGTEGDDQCLQRFGLTFGQPVETRNADKNAESFADRKVVAVGHQAANLESGSF